MPGGKSLTSRRLFSLCPHTEVICLWRPNADGGQSARRHCQVDVEQAGSAPDEAYKFYSVPAARSAGSVRQLAVQARDTTVDRLETCVGYATGFCSDWPSLDQLEREAVEMDRTLPRWEGPNFLTFRTITHFFRIEASSFLTRSAPSRAPALDRSLTIEPPTRQR